MHVIQCFLGLVNVLAVVPTECLCGLKSLSARTICDTCCHT